jgi:uncharacterized membrane protein
VADLNPFSAFGDDPFGRNAEKLARFFGTPRYILAQTVAVIAWITLNSIALISHWDPYPFILLNLAFSTQAAYAAPLILLAQTRQADRDKHHGEMIDKKHTRLEEAAKTQTEKLVALLEANTALTQQDKDLTDEVANLTRQIHELLTEKR